MKSKKTISLRTINNTDTQFLFELLKQRDHHTNISHKKMPTFAEHQKFVKSKQERETEQLIKNVMKEGFSDIVKFVKGEI